MRRPGADRLGVDVDELPPLTGSVLLDPWRIRYRRMLAGELDDDAVDTPRLPTESETLLWSRLRHEPQVWRAEVPTQYNCVLDFYCESAQLAVEVDGGYHLNPQVARRDDWRDAYHLTLGIATKRFTAREVQTDLDWVVDEIRALVAHRLGLPAHPQQPAVPAAEPVLWSWAGQLQAACIDVLPLLPAQHGLFARLTGH